MGKKNQENGVDQTRVEQQKKSKGKEREAKREAEFDLDKVPQIFRLVNKEEDISKARKHIMLHLRKILSRHTVSENYKVLFLYDTNKSISQEIADKIYNAIPNENDKPILLIINNTGGRIEPAYLISKSCKELSEKFVVAVPRKAKSAATLLSLGGDEIHMGTMSELGPIDPQFGGLPALGLNSSLESLAKIVTKYPKSNDMFGQFLSDKLDLRILGYFERVSESAKQYAIRLLQGKAKQTPVKIEEIARTFVYEYKDHTFVIDKDEAKKSLGSIIKSNTPEYELANDIHKFMSNLNFFATVLKSKYIGIIGSLTDIEISDKEPERD